MDGRECYIKRHILPALALGHDARDLVQPAVRAGRAVLDDIAADLAGSAALAGLGGPPLDGPAARVDVEAGAAGLAFRRGRVLGVVGFGGGTVGGGDVGDVGNVGVDVGTHDDDLNYGRGANIIGGENLFFGE